MSTPQIGSGAILTCSCGMAPASLTILPVNRVTSGGMPAATIMDNLPIVNIPPFGMCSSMANPNDIAATAAALGVQAPMPCMPVTVAPWVPGTPNVTIAGLPALDTNCTLMCAWGGVIAVTQPAQVTVTVP